MLLTHRLLLLPVAVLTAVLVGALAVPAQASADASAEVRLTDAGFAPAVVRVEAGEDVVWVNGTEREQTIVAEGGAWDSGPLQPGETFSVALRDPGTVRYATEDGVAEGRVIVGTAPDGGDEADEAAQAAASESEDGSTLPVTGPVSPALAGWALFLLGAGAIALRRAGDLRARVTGR
jgi:plastocyanin